MFVADSAVYGAESLEALRGLRWLCRVPLSVKEAKEAVRGIAEEEFATASAPALAGYEIHQTISDYGEVSQRWLVVQGEELRAAALSKLEKKLRRLEEELGKKLKRNRSERNSAAKRTRKRPPPSSLEDSPTTG